jgi:hypothetical protein
MIKSKNNTIEEFKHVQRERENETSKKKEKKKP